MGDGGSSGRFRHFLVKPAAYNQVQVHAPRRRSARERRDEEELGGGKWAGPFQGPMGRFGGRPVDPEVSLISGSSKETGGARTWSEPSLFSSC